MPWTFLLWVICFCLQAALVGFEFFVLIQLFDFEEDLLNNFDCATRCNRLVVCLAPDVPRTVLHYSMHSLSDSMYIHLKLIVV
jgi:hypothetical protein